MSNIPVKRTLVTTLSYLLCFLFSFPSLVYAQAQQIQDFLVKSIAVVRADKGEEKMHADVGDIDVQFHGYYRILALIHFDSGDEQKNESFYLTVVAQDGTISTPEDPNAGPYKVVPDQLREHPVWTDAGLFYLQDGLNTIKMHHYATIADQYPQFLNGPIQGPESVKIADSVMVVAEPRVDGALELEATTLHIENIGGEKAGLAYPGETVSYELIVRNQYLNLIRSARLYNQLPPSLTATEFSYPPTEQSGKLIMWDLPHIEPQDSFVISFTAILPKEMPPGFTPLVDEAKLVAPNDIDTTNNYAVSTIYALADSNGRRPDSADVLIALASTTDSVVVIGEDSVNVVKPGEGVEYRLIVINHGPDFARDVLVTNIVSPYFNVENTSIAPEQISGDTLIWRFESLAPDSSVQILYDGKVSISIPEEDSLLIAQAQAIAANDSLLDNNFAADTVRIIIEKPRNVDLALGVQAITDTNIVIAGDTVQAVKEGGRYSYRLTIENRGPGTAYHIGLWDIIPDSVSVSEFTLEPTLQKGDSLYWAVDSLEAGSSLRIDFNATVADSLPYYPYELVAIGEIVAEQDTTTDNNRISVRVYVIESKKPVPPPQNVDLALGVQAITDTNIVIAGDTVQAVKEGGRYSYRLTIENRGPGTAYHIGLWDIIPDSVSVSEFTLEPTLQKGDSLYWAVDSLEAGSSLRIDFNATVADSLPYYPYELVAVGEIVAEQDTTDANNRATVRVYVFEKPVVNEQPDVNVYQYAVTDSFAIVGGDTLKYAREGETYTYYVVVGNTSLVDAKNVIVKDVFPDSVTVGNFQPSPILVDQDSIIWSFETLPSNSTRTLRFDLRVPPLMPIGLNYLINYVMVSTGNEDTTKLANNTSIDTVYNEVKIPPVLTPMIEAMPPVVDVTDSIRVRVRVLPVSPAIWDLWIYFPDGQIEKAFADDFIATTKLMPDVWYEIDEVYRPLRLVSAGKEDQLVFEIRTRDVRGNEASAQAVVLVRSSNYLVLDRNVFKPEFEDPLGIRFKLSYRRIARLDIYDISGRHIVKLTEDVYEGGWNTYPWDGMSHEGQKIGSGVYLVTLRAGEFNSWKKFIIVR